MRCCDANSGEGTVDKCKRRDFQLVEFIIWLLVPNSSKGAKGVESNWSKFFVHGLLGSDFLFDLSSNRVIQAD